MTKNTFLKIVDSKAKKLGIRKYKVFFRENFLMDCIGFVDSWDDENKITFAKGVLDSRLRKDFIDAIIVHELEHLDNFYMSDGHSFENMLKKKYPKYGKAIGWAKQNRETILADIFKFVPSFY